jgi:hypothetical protein
VLRCRGVSFPIPDRVDALPWADLTALAVIFHDAR